MDVFLIRATPELTALWNETVRNYRREYAPIGSRIRAAALGGGFDEAATSEASELLANYERWAENELPGVATHRAATDASGDFRLTGIPRGRVFLFVKWRTSRWLKYWMLDHELRDPVERVLLNHANVWPLDRASAVYGTAM